MNDHAETRTQFIACGLLLTGLIAIAASDHFNFRDLANAGTMVLGIGGGLLTGKALNQSTKPGDIKNVNPSDGTSEEPKA